MNNPSKIKPAGTSTYQHRQAIGGAKGIRTPDLATGSSVGLWDCRLVRRRQRWRPRDLLSVVSESVHHASQHRAVRFGLADWSAANAYCLRVGLSTAMIPVEMLPTFWAEWVAPWAPQLQHWPGVAKYYLRRCGRILCRSSADADLEISRSYSLSCRTASSSENSCEDGK